MTTDSHEDFCADNIDGLNVGEQGSTEKPVDEIKRLAKLSRFDYEQCREDVAKKLKIRVTKLDLFVDDEGSKSNDGEEDGGSYQVVEDIEPWDEEVHGIHLANEVETILKRHVVLPEYTAPAITIWVMGSYCMKSWRVWSKLLITSPQKRCGKSVLMETLEGLVYKALLTSNITASALFRSIESWHPTLLIDEADTFAADNDELNGIINCGHTRRTARVIRSEKVGETHEPKVFDVWSPQVIAGIGKQRGTLEDRSIKISMRRRAPGETSVKLKTSYYEDQVDLRRQLLKWSEQNTYSLKNAHVEMPSCGNDRAEDNWRSLFAIADNLGGGWPAKIKESFEKLNILEDDEAGTMLLEDMQSIFKDTSKIHSETVIEKLIAMDHRPWSEWKHGYPLTKNTVAWLLKPYDIKSKQVRIGKTNRNGYKKEQFTDAFNRYLIPISVNTPLQNSTPLQASPDAGFSQNQNSTGNEGKTQNSTAKRPPDAGCRGVEFPEGDIEGEGVVTI